MFVFVVPLKGRAACKDWRLASWLCVQSIGSMLADPGRDVRVILACNERPEGLPRDDRLIVSQIVTPTPTSPEEGMIDCYTKFKAALCVARNFAPAWVMRADADDLISSRLVSFAREQKAEVGQHWFSEFGWMHRLGSRYMVKRDAFHQLCGTSHFGYVDKDELPTTRDDPADCYLLREGHPIIVESRRAAGMTVRAVPFPTTVYMRNSGENWSGRWALTDHGRRDRLRLLLKVRPLTTRLRHEFGLMPMPQDQSQPADRHSPRQAPANLAATDN